MLYCPSILQTGDKSVSCLSSLSVRMRALSLPGSVAPARAFSCTAICVSSGDQLLLERISSITLGVVVVQKTLGCNPGFVDLEDANLVPVDKLAKTLAIVEIAVQMNEPLITFGELTPEVWPLHALLTRHVWSNENRWKHGLSHRRLAMRSSGVVLEE